MNFLRKEVSSEALTVIALQCMRGEVLKAREPAASVTAIARIITVSERKKENLSDEGIRPIRQVLMF